MKISSVPRDHFNNRVEGVGREHQHGGGEGPLVGGSSSVPTGFTLNSSDKLYKFDQQLADSKSCDRRVSQRVSATIWRVWVQVLVEELWPSGGEGGQSG